MSDAQTQTEAPPEAGLSELDRIALEASGDEREQEAADQAILHPEKENMPDPATAWAQIPAMFGGLICMALPDLKPAYSEANCMKWGAAMSQVADKYGWDAGETMAKWAPEIALVVATLPLAVPTIAAIRDARKKAEAEKPRVTAPQNGAVDMHQRLDENGLPIGGNFVNPE